MCKVYYWCANKQIRARSNTIIGTWNVRTVKDTGKLEELEHELTRYNWNILALCESRLLKAGEKSTQEGHRLYWSGPEDTHERDVGFIVHKNSVNCVMNCCPFQADSLQSIWGLAFYHHHHPGVCSNIKLQRS